MSGRRSRAKGAAGERELVRALRELLPAYAERIARGAPMQASDPAGAPDVLLPGCWPECKRQARPNIRAALDQAEGASQGTGLVPLAVTRADRGRWLVTMSLDDFAAMYAEWERGR